jgi:hypothetical protein
MTKAKRHFHPSRIINRRSRPSRRLAAVGLVGMLITDLSYIVLGGAAAGLTQASHVWTPVDSSWKLTFDDEFNKSALKSSWSVTPYQIDPAAALYWPHYQAYSSPYNVYVNNGLLHMLVRKHYSTIITAGITNFHYDQSYGYWEARIKTPCMASGVANAFWLDTKNFDFPEIDIIEWMGSQPNVMNFTWHYKFPKDEARKIGKLQVSDAMSCGKFHILGVWRSHNFIRWYLDGQQQGREITEFVNSENAIPQGIIFSATVGGFPTSENFLGSSTHLPSEFLIDYVHVYSQEQTATAEAPDPGYGGPGDTVGSGD